MKPSLLVTVFTGSLFFLSASAAAQQPSATGDTLEYFFLLGKTQAGFYKKWKNPDGSMSDWFQYNDRGRGDSMRTTWKTNERGFPLSLEASGYDYFRNPVRETFSLSNGRARWESEAEKEEQKVDGEFFFIGIHGSVDAMKALRTSGKSINLLPSGRLKLDSTYRVAFNHNGSTVELLLVRTSGVGLTPSYGWYDLNEETFAFVSDWGTQIRRGYENLKEDLLKRQKVEEERYFRELGSKLVERYDSGIALTNVNLFDSERGTAVPGSTVLIKDGLIADVGPARSVKIPKGFKVIDGTGRTVTPGLWDMHVHYQGPEEGLLHLAAGVTSVRDLANSESIMQKKKQIDDGELVGPRIVSMAGFVDGAGPYAGPTGKIISSVEEGIEAIRFYARAGYQQIKLYSSIKPEWVKPLADETKRNGMRLSGHVPAFMTAEQAVRAGYDEIQHANMIFLNFMGDTIDTRTPLRFSVVGRHAASIDLKGEPVKAFVRLLKEHRTVIDPTVAVFEALFTARPGKPDKGTEMIIPRLPIQWQRFFRAAPGIPVPEGMDETYRRSADAMLNLVRMLHDEGITLVAGTDGFAGFTLHRELELYAQSGIPTAEVLRIATYGAASVAGKEKQLGSIRKGKIADLIVIHGNPLERMSDIRNVELVVKDGKMYDAGKLYEAISIRPGKGKGRKGKGGE